MKYIYTLGIVICFMLASVSFSQIPTDGLVGYWPFNGNTHDESGNENNGTTNGGITWGTDRFGNPSGALFLDRTGFVTIASSASLDIRTSLTLAVWFKSNEMDQFNQLIYRGDPTPIADPYWIRTQDSKIRFERDYQQVYSPTVEYSITGLDTSRFHFFIGTYDHSNGSMKLFIDGAHVLEEIHPGTFNYATSQMYNVIGGIDDYPACHGFLDDIRIYNRALSESEIRTLYHEGGWKIPTEEFFDDFCYRNYYDDNLKHHGWQVSSECNKSNQFVPSYISFETNTGNNSDSVMILQSTITNHELAAAEIHSKTKYFEGTYAAMIKFDDGDPSWMDRNVQTFFGINSWKYLRCCNLYSELDFEYLPYHTWSGYNFQSTLNPTSWAEACSDTPQDNPKATFQYDTLLGDVWHMLIIDANDGNSVKYYLDDLPVGPGQNKVTHLNSSLSVYPKTQISIRFENWVNSIDPLNNDPKSWKMAVDWIYHVKGLSMSRQEIMDRVQSLRTTVGSYKDNIQAEEPNFENVRCTRNTIDCPVLLHVYDSQGRHTGPINDTTWEVDIPGSYYVAGNLSDPLSQKTIVMKADDTYTMKIVSQDTTAFFNLKVTDYQQGYQLKSISFDSINIQPNSTATCSLESVTPLTQLFVDYDGNGTIDTIFLPRNYHELTTNFVVDSKWNLVSIPSKAVNNKKSELFPSAISNAFAYESNYIERDTLINGVGYWLKFSSPETVRVVGIPVETETLEVNDGWNIIGSISDPIAVSSIISDPPGIVTSSFFGYNDSYVISDTIYPGRGYWIKINQSGKLILSSNTSVASTANIKILPTSEMPPPPPSNENSGVNYLPKVFSLAQNYPNPFNPLTSIRYGVPEKSHVTMSVYNTLGQCVVLLVDEKQEAGYHEVTFDGSGLTSGVYFYRLQAGDFVQTKKLLLMK